MAPQVLRSLHPEDATPVQGAAAELQNTEYIFSLALQLLSRVRGSLEDPSRFGLVSRERFLTAIRAPVRLIYNQLERYDD